MIFSTLALQRYMAHGNRHYFDLGGSDPDPQVGAAALQAQQLSKEALDWAKEREIASRPLQDAVAKKAIQVADQQLASSKANDALSAEYADYNRTTFRPLEKGIVADAESYDTPEKRQAAADAAMTDVNLGLNASNEARARQLAANGIDPGSTRAMSVMEGQGVDQAVASAGAAYRARKGVETVGHAMKMDAASLGRGLPSAQATSAQVAMQAGNAAVANANTPLANANAQTGMVGNGFNTAINGTNIAGNLYGKAAEIGANDNGLMGALGGVAGQFAGSAAGSKALVGLLGMSDETVKTDIEPVDPEQALEEVAGTGVSNFRYDPAKLAARGVSPEAVPEGESTGPMAQDVNAKMGEQAGPDGKMVNLVTLNGKTMASVQALKARGEKTDASVQALGKKVDNLAALIRGGQREVRAA